MNYSKDQIFTAFKQQPDSVRWFILAPESANIIETISKKYNLSQTQSSDLASECSLLLTHLTQKNSFAFSLVTRLRIDQATAENISRDVEEKVVKVAATFVPKEESDLPTYSSRPAPTPEVAKPFSTPQPQYVPPPSNLPELPEEHHLAIRRIEQGATYLPPKPKAPVQNPTPISATPKVQPVFVAPKIVPQQAPKIQPVQTIPTQVVQTSKVDNGPQTIMGAKLTRTFGMPIQEISVNPKKPEGSSLPAQQDPTKPKFDPYREQI